MASRTLWAALLGLVACASRPEPITVSGPVPEREDCERCDSFTCLDLADRFAEVDRFWTAHLLENACGNDCGVGAVALMRCHSYGLRLDEQTPPYRESSPEELGTAECEAYFDKMETCFANSPGTLEGLRKSRHALWDEVRRGAAKHVLEQKCRAALNTAPEDCE